MNNLEQLYLDSVNLLKNRKEHLVLVMSDDENYCQIFISEEVKSLIARLRRMESSAVLKEICISGYIDDADKSRIINSIRTKVYFETDRLLKHDEVKNNIPYNHENSVVGDLSAIINSNECFSLFFKKKFKIVNESSVKDLMLMNIMTVGDGGLEFTKYGKLLFAEKCEYDRKIYISNYSVNNKIRYSNDWLVDGPIYNSLGKADGYLISLIPEFQERSGIQSSIYTALDKTLLKQILLYVLAYNNYDSFENIKFELNPVSFSVTFSYEENNILSGFFKKFEGMIELDKFISDLNTDKYTVMIQNKNHYKIIRVLYTKSMNIYDEDLEPIDYQIIDFIKKNGKIKRCMIDNEFSISCRNSNNHLNKLINKEIISAEGQGKSVVYMINSK